MALLPPSCRNGWIAAGRQTLPNPLALEDVFVFAVQPSRPKVTRGSLVGTRETPVRDAQRCVLPSSERCHSDPAGTGPPPQ
jgi:hypothetical protein